MNDALGTRNKNTDKALKLKKKLAEEGEKNDNDEVMLMINFVKA